MGGKSFFKYFLYITSTLLAVLVLGSSFQYVLTSQRNTLQSSVKGTSVYLAQGTCEEPTEGCGMNHYWDYNTCSCVYDGTCVEPVPGCGEDYYWDHHECVCVPHESSSCSEPSGGCGTDHYWDLNTCSCVYYNPTPTSCSEPSGGCGGEYYWDSGSCSCIPNPTPSECPTPSSGCPDNYYWNYSTCSCVSDGSCQPPSGGCEEDKYWDWYSCSCVNYSSGGSCPEPLGGCGENWYWNYEYCECRLSTTDSENYMTPTPTTSSYSYSTTTFDRLAYETDEIIGCVRDKLTDTEYDTFRYNIAETEEEREYIYSLGEKARFCWTTYVNLTTDNPEETLSSTKISIENESCLIRLIGESAYREIHERLREPTERERLAFKSCYETKTTRTVTYKSDEEEFDNATQQCLRLALGSDVFSKIVEGQTQPTSTQLIKINICFGIIGQPFDEGLTYKVPDKVRTCLQTTLGVSVFSQISSGKREPTQSEKEKSKSCFGGINPLQKKFLPIPVEEVPFLDPEPEVIKVIVANQAKRNIRNKEVGGAIVLSGSGPPNSTVNIYIYSDPIVVTTETDENGDWVYELKNPLDGKEHIVYATVRGGDGRVVRSSVFDFTVVAADTDSIQPLLDESKSSDAQGKFVKAATIMVAIASVVVIIIGIIIYLINAKLLKEAVKKANSRSTFGSSDGESEGDGSSGSVN